MPHHPRIPLWLKLAYTLFMCVMVPTYWHAYGPLNFLWLCDVTAFVALVALWLQSPLVASMGAVAMTVSQTLWTLDLLTRLFHVPVSRMGPTSYMFEPGISLFVRLMSLFHVWMPVLLLWMVWKLGYDRRAWLMQSILAIVVLEACFLFTPRPPATPLHPRGLNINWVFGPGYDHPQTWMHPVLFITLQMVFYPLCIYLPTHLVFRRIFRPPIESHSTSAESDKPYRAAGASMR